MAMGQSRQFRGTNSIQGRNPALRLASVTQRPSGPRFESIDIQINAGILDGEGPAPASLVS